MTGIQKKKFTKVVYNDNREVILSNEIIENGRYNLSPNSFFLLLALSQAIDYQQKLFPEFYIEMAQLFKMFNLKENNNRRYEVIREMLSEITHNPLQIRKSLTNWRDIPWLAFDYNEEISTKLEISFHPKAIPYLLAFKNAIGLDRVKGYTYVLPEDIHQFQSKYSIMLYPFFKKWQDTKTWKEVEVVRTIRWTKEKTFTYKGNKYSRTSDWLKYVVNPVIKDVNEKSVLQVKKISAKNDTIRANEGGRTYTHIVFRINTKEEFITKKEEKKPVKFNSLEELQGAYSDIQEISVESFHAIQANTTMAAKAKSYDKTYHKVGGKHYFCKA